MSLGSNENLLDLRGAFLQTSQMERHVRGEVILTTCVLGLPYWTGVQEPGIKGARRSDQVHYGSPRDPTRKMFATK